MAHEIIALIAHYGLLLVFFSVLVDQVGAPLPAVPTLVVAGTLVTSRQLSIAGILLVAVVACLIGDLLWYWAGRHFGTGVMRTLCRISLSPDSCVRRTELHFERWGGQMLVIAKFVPGLSLVAPPLMGAMRLRLHVFLLLDGLGALLWASVPVGLGYVFAAQIDTLLAALASAGAAAFELVLGLLAVYIFGRWWWRRSLLMTLRMARITVEELNSAIMNGRAPLVVDVRSETSRRLDARIVPGALLVDIDRLGQSLHDVPLDQELVIYCNCPNEVSSASAAKALMARGYRHVRPLLGGLEAWGAAGYAVQRLPLSLDSGHEVGSRSLP